MQSQATSGSAKASSRLSKTNAARLLDAASIDYELIPYEVDETDLGAQHIADQLGEDIEQVFKTLVLQGDKTGHFVCVIPGAEEVDLKKAARVSGNKKVDLIPMKIAANNGIHPWRLLTGRHEKAFSDVYRRDLHPARLHLCERGCAWIAVQD